MAMLYYVCIYFSDYISHFVTDRFGSSFVSKTMTSEDWKPNLSLACQSTLLDPLGACEKALKKELKEISAQFTWLNEIIDKNCRLLSGKRYGFHLMESTILGAAVV